MKYPDVFEMLAATGPYADYADKLALFGQFVGSWDMEGIWYQKDGTRRTGTGEWYFDWILGGRGIQDVLFASGATAHQFGTTLRGYDPARGVWHLVWMQPASGEFVHLLGQKVGDRIVCEEIGATNGKRARWSFADITPDSFHWLGEVTNDDGATWFLEQEMRARRRK